ncbi:MULTISPECIES: hypothetical protein [Streptomyces]|uniref:hypothetical protein n=1 Tax=Streptomyces TaxID=1883 RepID=UPI0007CD7BD8|nr:hypothetical protein A4V12_18030 [Streptomyces noursei]
MYVDDDQPPRTPGAEPGSAQSIMDSFQRVLDDLDAARAELHRTGGLGTTAPPHVTVEPLWAREATHAEHGHEHEYAPPAEAQKRRWAGTCGVGAVGGLLVVSSMLGHGALGALGGGDAAPADRPGRPPHQDVRGTEDGARTGGRETPRRTYRIPRLQPGGGTHGHYAVEVRTVAARFQDPPAAGPR